MSDQFILGIDLGTTNSLAGYMTEGGPVLVEDASGESLIPSVLSFADDGSVTIGAEARAHAVERPLTTIYSVKRLMGRDIDDLHDAAARLPYRILPGPHGTVLVDVGGEGRTPQELSAMVLAEVRRRSEEALGREITEAVRSRFETEWTAYYTEPNDRRYWAGWLREVPFPDSMPQYRSFLVDRVGCLWVEHYRPFWDDQALWSVFDTDGTWLGECTGPGFLDKWPA